MPTVGDLRLAATPLLVLVSGERGLVGEDGDRVVDDLEEAAAYLHSDTFLRRLYLDGTCGEGGHDRFVVGEDSDLTVHCPGYHETRLAGPQNTFRRHDVYPHQGGGDDH